VWLGGDRYAAYCDLLATSIDLPRATRDADLVRHVQGYADRLAAHVRRAPYNWTNFFDFWAQ
jgi:predicted LPLAT superfamily acyltransferase